MNDGGPAFPTVENWRIDSGMSLRDYFASKAMHAYMVGYGNVWPSHETIAKQSYAMADAMLSERGK